MSVFMFFAYFGEPISQTAQTLLPPLLDAEAGSGNYKSSNRRSSSARGLFWKLLRLACSASIGVTVCSGLLLTTGAPLFSSDPVVIRAVRAAAPVVLLAQLQLPITTCIDGATVAARDFKFIMGMSVSTCAVQLLALRGLKTALIGSAADDGGVMLCKWAESLGGGGGLGMGTAAGRLLAVVWATFFFRLNFYSIVGTRRWLTRQSMPLHEE